MRCERCGFENMPGLTTCVRCRSVLTVTGLVAVIPPRAGWTKAFRPAAYWLNRYLGFHVVASFEGAVRRFVPRATAPALDLLAALASLLPGLGHLLQGRLGQIRWLWPSWLGALVLGVTFYGTVPGSVLLGIAMAIHALILCDAAEFRRYFERAALRIVAVMVVFFALSGLLYGAARGFIRGVRATAALPSDGIREGDHLIFRPRDYRTIVPQRGEVVLYRLVGRGLAPGVALGGGDAVGKVLGLPGERISLRAGTLLVESAGATQQAFVAPSSLAGLTLDVDVSQDHVFCLPLPVTIHAVGGIAAPPAEVLVAALGLAPRSAIHGRLFVIYNPIRRRRWTQGEPLEPATAPSHEPIR